MHQAIIYRRAIYTLVHIIFCYLALSLLVSEIAFASNVKLKTIAESDTLFGSPSTRNTGLVFDDNKILYFTRVNNTPGLYEFDTSQKIEKLVRPLNLDRGSWALNDDRPQAKGNGIALMSVFGRLYATDGTRSGTSLLKNFGTSIDIISSLGILHSVIRDIKFIDSNFYIVTSEFGTTTVQGKQISQVWISDGTVSGTRLVSDNHNFISGLFSTNAFGKQTIHFIARNENQETELWRLDTNDRPSLVANFGINTRIDVANNTATNSKGTYLCSETFSTSSSSQTSLTTLLRVSNNGTVTTIESDCTPETLATNHDFLFYSNRQGIWRTSGINGQKELLVSEVNTRSYGTNFCQNDDELTYLINNKLFSLKLAKLGTTNILTAGLQRSIHSCLGNKLVFRQNLSDTLFDKEINEETKITSQVQSGERLETFFDRDVVTSVGQYLRLKDDVYAFGNFEYADKNGRNRIRRLRLLKLQNSNTHFLAPLMLILEE